MIHWWYALGTKRYGPITTEELKKLALFNTVGAQTLIWCEGMTGWRKLDEIAELKGLLATAPPPLPIDAADKGKASSTTAEPPYISSFATERPQGQFAPSSDAPSPRFSDQAANAKESAYSEQAVYNQAKAWPRFFARIFDLWWEGMAIALVILMVAYATNLRAFTAWVGGLPFAPDYAFGMICIFAAFWLDVAVYGVFGNTPGKALLGLKVKTFRDHRLSLGDYLSRNLYLWVIGLFCGLPFLYLITMAWQGTRLSKGKQAIYDESLGYRVYTQQRGWAPKTAFALLFVGWLGFLGYIASSPHTEINYAATEGGQHLQDPYVSPRKKVMARLRRVAQTVNDKAPITIDDYTRLDGAKAGPGLQLTYFYSLVGVPSYQIDAQRLKRAMLPNLEKKACASMRKGLRLGATYVYDYRGSDGVEVTRVKITQSSC